MKIDQNSEMLEKAPKKMIEKTVIHMFPYRYFLIYPFSCL